jgi:hypothetical protein
MCPKIKKYHLAFFLPNKRDINIFIPLCGVQQTIFQFISKLSCFIGGGNGIHSENHRNAATR